MFISFWAIMQHEVMKKKSEACLQYDEITLGAGMHLSLKQAPKQREVSDEKVVEILWI